MNRLQDEFSTEYLLKYMKKERDNALSQLRTLQKRYDELKAENERLIASRDDYKANCKEYQAEISELTKEIMHTPPYKDLFKRYERLKQDNKDLQIKVGQLQRNNEIR